MRELTGDEVEVATVRHEISEEGYVLLRGFVPRDEALAVADDMRRVLHRRGWTDAAGRAVRSPRKGAEPEGYWPLYTDVLALERFNALPFHPRLQGLMRALLGPTAFTFPEKVARLVFPSQQGGSAIPMHRDNRGGPWVQDLFTTWVALDDLPPELGGLAVLRRSQTYEYAALSEVNGRLEPVPGGRPPPPDDSPEWVTAAFEAGDVVVFHCYALHKGVPNVTAGVRLSADYRWQLAGQRAHLGTLAPYHYFGKYPRIPGWRRLTEGWDTRAWIDHPPELPIIRSKWPDGYDTRVPPSRFVEVVPGAREAWRPDTRRLDLYDVSFELPRDVLADERLQR